MKCHGENQPALYQSSVFSAVLYGIVPLVLRKINEKKNGNI